MIKKDKKKKNKSVKSQKEYLKELENLKVISRFDERNKILLLKFNVVVHPYIRQRSGKYSTYDPLGKYKSYFRDKINESIEPYKNDLLKLKGYSISEKIDVKKVPLPSYSIKDIFTKLSNPESANIFKPDVDNYVKSLNDIFNMSEELWDDDSQVYNFHINKSWDILNETKVEIHYIKENSIDPNLLNGNAIDKKKLNSEQLEIYNACVKIKKTGGKKNVGTK